MPTNLILPCVVWTDPQELYRIVLLRDEEENRLTRRVEYCDGYDLLGAKRWSQLDMTRYTGNNILQITVNSQWLYLATALMNHVAPLPAKDNAAEEAGALDQAAEDRARDQPAAELAEAVKEDEGRPYLACRGCGDMLSSAIDTHALIERAHKEGWRTFVAWDGRHPQGAYALCPDCTPQEAGREP